MSRRLSLALLLIATIGAGCGGHGAGNSSSGASASTTSVGKGPGSAVLKVQWPARSSTRLIPNAANAITVSLSQGSTVVATKTIPRPDAGQTATSTMLTGLAYGTYMVSVAGYPNADGSGVAQASGAGSMTVTEDTPGALSVTMDSTVASLSISGVSGTVATGDACTVTASAKDANGAVVLLSASGGSEPVSWSVDDPGVASVSGTGPSAILTGIAAGGPTTIHASLRVKDDGTHVDAPGAPVQVATQTLTLNADASCVYGGKAGLFGRGVSPNTFAVVGTLAVPPSSSTTVPVTVSGPASLYSPLAFGPSSTVSNLTGTPTQVESDTVSTLTATYRTLQATTSVTIKPNPLASLTGPSTLASGAKGTGTVTLGLLALVDEDVALSCDDSTVVLPAKATVPKPSYEGDPATTLYLVGHRISSFSITAPTVSAARTVTITATRAGVSKSFVVTITP